MSISTRPSPDNDICWDCEHCRCDTCPVLDKKPNGRHGLSCKDKYTNPRVEYGDSPRTKTALREYLAGKTGSN